MQAGRWYDGGNYRLPSASILSGSLDLIPNVSTGGPEFLFTFNLSVTYAAYKQRARGYSVPARHRSSAPRFLQQGHEKGAEHLSGAPVDSQGQARALPFLD